VFLMAGGSAMKRFAHATAALALALGPLVCHGDSSYQVMTQVTGGQLVDSLTSIPILGKKFKSLTDPVTTTTMVHGNQKAVVTSQTTEIYDLDKQEVIHIDTVHKQYSVDTFADMRKAMAQAPAMINQAQAQAAAAPAPQAPAPPSNLQFSFSVSVKDTGLQQVISGLSATQHILTLTATVTDTSNPGNTATYTTTSEIWTTPDLPEEMKDSQDFDARFEQALMSGVDLSAYMGLLQNASSNAAAMTQMFASNPGAAGAFVQAGKEMSKITGTQILVKTSMGGSGTGAAASQGSNAGSQPAPDNGGSSPSLSTSSLGAALVSGIFGKKKSQPANPPASSTSSSSQTSGETVLLETTTQDTNFSHDSVPASSFEVPAGFKQVPSPLAQALANAPNQAPPAN